MRRRPLLVPLALVLLLGGAPIVAQIEGDNRGVAAIDSGGSYEVSDVTVDISAKTAEAARLGGWRLAQRKAWTQLSQRLGGGGGMVSDGTLDSIVSGIVVAHEEIGPTRYIARLGVLFDRARAGALLGVSAYGTRSPPMLVIPVEWSGGIGTAFEQKTAWQQAWARFRTGNSSIDYVRPAGTGPDALLLNVGQTGRPSRGWWRAILDQYGAYDVVIPTVKLYRQWPGGPVIGVFQARHGPDNKLLDSVTLRVASDDGLQALLDTGVQRLDAFYQQALKTGQLHADPTLSPPPAPTPAATATPAATDDGSLDQIMRGVTSAGAGGAQTGGIAITVQFDTPSASSVAATENALRAIPGVRSAQTTSLAFGGLSVMRVLYDGDPDALRAALQTRGYQVFGQGQSIRIRRIPQLVPSNLPADRGPGG